MQELRRYFGVLRSLVLSRQGQSFEKHFQKTEILVTYIVDLDVCSPAETGANVKLRYVGSPDLGSMPLLFGSRRQNARVRQESILVHLSCILPSA